MFSLVSSSDGPSDSPSGGLEQDSPSDGPSDSPSGGASNTLGRSSDSPSGGPSNSPSGRRSKLRPLYWVAHIRCQLSGRASPSRTNFLPETRQPFGSTKLFRVREREMADHACLVLREIGDFGEPSPPPIYSEEQGVRGVKISPKRGPPPKTCMPP